MYVSVNWVTIGSGTGVLPVCSIWNSWGPRRLTWYSLFVMFIIMYIFAGIMTSPLEEIQTLLVGTKSLITWPSAVSWSPLGWVATNAVPSRYEDDILLWSNEFYSWIHTLSISIVKYLPLHCTCLPCLVTNVYGIQLMMTHIFIASFLYEFLLFQAC